MKTKKLGLGNTCRVRGMSRNSEPPDQNSLWVPTGIFLIFQSEGLGLAMGGGG